MPRDLGPCPTCSGTGRLIAPDPPPKSREEKAAFSQDWDARFDAWRKAAGADPA